MKTEYPSPASSTTRKQSEPSERKRTAFDVINAAWECNIKDKSVVLVLLALAKFSDADGGRIFPSVPTLAKYARMSERNLRYILRKLENAQIITIVEQRRGRKYGNVYNTNSYQINLQKLLPCEVDEQESPPADMSDSAHVNLQNQACKPAKSDIKPATRLQPICHPDLPAISHTPRADASGGGAETDERLRAEGKGKEKGRASKKSTSSASRTSPKKTPCPTVKEFLTDERVAFVRETYPGVKASYITEIWHNSRRSEDTTRVNWEYDWKAFFSSYAVNHADEFKRLARSAPPPPARPLTEEECANSAGQAAMTRAQAKFDQVLSSDERDKFYKSVGKAAYQAFLQADRNLSLDRRHFLASSAGHDVAEAFKQSDTDKSVGTRAEEALAVSRARYAEQEEKRRAEWQEKRRAGQKQMNYQYVPVEAQGRAA